MKEILISIQPQWVEKILNGEKTIEIRKTMPNCKMPVKVYIYVTKNKSWGDKLIYVTDPLNVIDPFYELGYKFNSIPKVNGKVVAEFTLNKVDELDGADAKIEKLSCLTMGELYKYANGKNLYAWHIIDLKVYDKPKELGEFRKFCGNNGQGCPDSNCPYYEEPSYEYGEVNHECDFMKPLTKASQSWQYVNHVEKEN